MGRLPCRREPGIAGGRIGSAAFSNADWLIFRPAPPTFAEMVAVFARTVVAAGFSLLALCAAAWGDALHLSLMPDPRGEFIRLCAPFMVSRYAHPEAICDCVRTAIRGEIADRETLDAILFAITEQGVPSIDPKLIAAEKRPLIDHTLSAIAQPTMECMFGSGKAKEPDLIPKDGATNTPPPMDLVP
jgi:hypothetical protein